MTKDVETTNKKQKTIADYLSSQKVKNEIALAMPKHLDIERVSRIALSEIRKNKFLQRCDHVSLLKCIAQASSLGLEVGSVLGHAYLVPYKTEATLIVGYKGFIELARRSGQIESICAHEVYENDLFEFQYGLNPDLKHVPTRNERGDVIAFYACATLKDGGKQFEVMWKDQVDQVRSMSASYKSQGSNSIWSKHYGEMGRKTLIRRLFKYLPVSIEIQRAVSIDEKQEVGVPVDDDYIDLDLSDFEEEKPNENVNQLANAVS